MKCINEALIQKYIDGETTAKEDASIRSHISDCNVCTEKIEIMQQRANRIKHITSLTNEKAIEIPEFINSVSNLRLGHNRFRKIIYAASAACILFIALFVFEKSKDKSTIEFIYSYDLENEFNANLPVSEQEMEIIITDSEGRLIKY